MMPRLWHSPWFRWARLISIIWLVPAALLWGAWGSFLRIRTHEEIQKTFDVLESQLEDISGKSEPEVFFQKHLNDFFQKHILGKPNQGATIERAVSSFKSRFPRGLFKMFFFDGNGIALAPGKHHESATRFFEIIRKPWTEEFTISPHESAALNREFPFPNRLMQFMKQRPRRVHALVGIEKMSWGFFDWREGVPANRIGGILVFMSREAMNSDYVLKRVIREFQKPDAAFGYVLEGEKTLVPAGVPRVVVRQMVRLFKTMPGGQFEWNGWLGVVSRLNQSTLLLGVSSVSGVPRVPFVFSLILFLLYGFASLIFFRAAYRAVILSDPVFVSVKWKFALFFILTFGLPLFLALICGAFLLRNQLYGSLEEYQYTMLKRLTFMDNRFEGHLQRRLLHFRQFHNFMCRNVDRPRRLLDAMSELKFKGSFDSVWFVASDSSFLVSPMKRLGVDLSRLSQQPFRDRLEFFSNMVERGGIPSWLEMPLFVRRNFPPLKRDNYPYPANIVIPPDVLNDPFVRFNLFLQETAFDEFHRVRGLETRQKKEFEKLVVGSFMGEAGDQIQMRARSSMGRWMPIEAFGHFGLNYYNIVPGRDGYAAYSYTFDNDLLHLEHAFLDSVYHKGSIEQNGISQNDKPSTSFLRHAPPREAMMVCALSYTPHARCFPDFSYFRQFEHILGRLEKSKHSLSLKTNINGEPWLVVALKCRFLKHYMLVGAVPVRLALAEFAKTREFLLWAFVAAIAIGGAFLNWLFDRFWTPVHSFSKASVALKEKRFDFRVPWNSEDEFGQLARSFDQTLAFMQDLEIGRAVQQRILPQKRLVLSGFEMEGRNEMAQAIGGDYFDFIRVSPTQVAVVFGDVAGHGMSAALVTAVIKAAMTFYCRRFPMEPHRVFQRINRYMLDQLKKKKMMTCFLGFLDEEKRKMIFCNAGQTYPILIHPDGQAEMLKRPTSPPLGILGKASYASYEFDFKDQTVLLYSDGLVELRDEKNVQLGFEGFLSLASQAFNAQPAFPLQTLFRAIRAFSGSVDWLDDATAVFIRPRVFSGIPSPITGQEVLSQIER